MLIDCTKQFFQYPISFFNIPSITDLFTLLLTNCTFSFVIIILKGKANLIAKYMYILYLRRTLIKAYLYMRCVKNDICVLHQMLRISNCSSQLGFTVCKLDIDVVHRPVCLGKT
jgi:hypothetical protein